MSSSNLILYTEYNEKSKTHLQFVAYKIVLSTLVRLLMEPEKMRPLKIHMKERARQKRIQLTSEFVERLQLTHGRNFCLVFQLMSPVEKAGGAEAT